MATPTARAQQAPTSDWTLRGDPAGGVDAAAGRGGATPIGSGRCGCHLRSRLPTSTDPDDIPCFRTVIRFAKN